MARAVIVRFGTAALICDLRVPHAIMRRCRGEPRAGADRCAALCGIHRVQYYQPAVIDPAIGIHESVADTVLQCIAVLAAGNAHAVRGGQATPATHMIVEEQARADLPAWPQPFDMRQHEAQRPDDVGCDCQQPFAFDQRLPDQPEFEQLQVTQSAVDELGAGGGSGGCKIGLLHQHDLVPPPGCITRNADAIDAAPDDQQIDASGGSHLNPRSEPGR